MCWLSTGWDGSPTGTHLCCTTLAPEGLPSRSAAFIVNDTNRGVGVCVCAHRGRRCLAGAGTAATVFTTEGEVP